MSHITFHKKNQKDILLTLIQGTEGRSWAANRTGWDRPSGIDVCFWEGVVCDLLDKKTVIGISLPSANLAATIPTEIGLLKSLKDINLSQNAIYGPIPASFAKLTTLESIDMSKNSITGTFPNFSSSLLRVVKLVSNKIGGRLHEDFGTAHAHLVSFEVAHNQMIGPIPDSVSALHTLDTLSLSENIFSGTIPASIGEIRTLRYLYLDNNKFQGTIPPSIARFDSPLAEIWLHENILTGTIPAEVADLQNLFNFYVDGNMLTGTVPMELCHKELNADFFGSKEDDDWDDDADDDDYDDDYDDDDYDDDYDEDRGKNDDDTGKKNNTASDRDYCESVACPEGYSAPLGVWPCTKCDSRRKNPYLGKIGECMYFEEIDVLQTMWIAMNGPDWTDIANPWDGEDGCSFTGVTCNIKKHVVRIDLKGRKATGTIPPEIGFLERLTFLDLSDNDLTGFIPSDLRWAPLETFKITGNRIKGIVPFKLCEKEGMNGNGENGKFSCDHIACSSGYFSPTGKTEINGKKCEPCKNGLSFVSARKCLSHTGSALEFFTHESVNPDAIITTKTIFGISAFATVAVLLLINLIQRYRRRSTSKGGHMQLPSFEMGTKSKDGYKVDKNEVNDDEETYDTLRAEYKDDADDLVSHEKIKAQVVSKNQSKNNTTLLQSVSEEEDEEEESFTIT